MRLSNAALPNLPQLFSILAKQNIKAKLLLLFKLSTSTRASVGVTNNQQGTGKKILPLNAQQQRKIYIN